METNGEKLLMRCDRITLKLPEKNENADGTACAEILALRGQKFDQNRPLWNGSTLQWLHLLHSVSINDEIII